MTSIAPDELIIDELVSPDGHARVVLHGRLDARTTVTCWNLVEQIFRAKKIKQLQVDAGNLQFCDGAGLALLRYLT